MNNKETIESLYFEEKKNLTEISKILNISPTTVRKYLNNYLNIKPYTKRNQDFKNNYKLS